MNPSNGDVKWRIHRRRKWRNVALVEEWKNGRSFYTSLFYTLFVCWLTLKKVRREWENYPIDRSFFFFVAWGIGKKWSVRKKKRNRTSIFIKSLYFVRENGWPRSDFEAGKWRMIDNMTKSDEIYLGLEISGNEKEYFDFNYSENEGENKLKKKTWEDFDKENCIAKLQKPLEENVWMQT